MEKGLILWLGEGKYAVSLAHVVLSGNPELLKE